VLTASSQLDLRTLLPRSAIVFNVNGRISLTSLHNHPGAALAIDLMPDAEPSQIVQRYAATWARNRRGRAWNDYCRHADPQDVEAQRLAHFSGPAHDR